MAQPVKEAGFYVLGDSDVKEQYRLFFRFLWCPPPFQNLFWLMGFLHPVSR